MNFNYRKTCQVLLEPMPKRTKKVLLRRFGLEKNKKETLEAIGKDYGITRERVRQIERDGLLRIKSKIKNIQNISQFFTDELKRTGNLRKEDVLLGLWGGQRQQNHIYFLLTLADEFDRFAENQALHSLWTIDQNSLNTAQKIIKSLQNKLEKINRPLCLRDFRVRETQLSAPAILSYLEVSKKIQQNQEGLFGLNSWPEINPKGIKDRAYLVFKKEKKPLHFKEAAELINHLGLFQNKKSRALPQTVHNELIKDPRFVLVGRGLYALKEWGFEPGTVLDIIKRTIKMSKRPLAKDQIVKKVLKQRMVKENTILLNLANKKHFEKDGQSKYKIKQA